MLIMVLGAALTLILGPIESAAAYHWVLLGLTLLFFAATLGLHRLSHRLPISQTINLLLVGITLYITLVAPPGSLEAGPVLILYVLPVTIAALLLTPDAGLIWAAIAALAVFIRTSLLTIISAATDLPDPTILIAGILFLFLQAALHRFAARSFFHTQHALRQQINQIQTGVEIGHMVTAAVDPSAITHSAVQMIHSAFGYYHVGLFTLDPEGEVAVLVDAAGEAAAGLKEKGFPVPVNSMAAVAVAIRQKCRRTILTWREDRGPGGRPIQFTYDRLPSRAELVIPLQVGDQVLGALDIHSLTLDPFPEEDIHVLEGLAGNIANALASAHLLDDIQRRHHELAQVHDQTERRARYLETTAEMARTISSIQDPQELPDKAVHLIGAGLDLYHTAIFLVDTTREWAVLAAASSEGGKQMLARGHKLRVGEQGIVGWVARAGQPHIASPVHQDARYIPNPDLPHTRSEIALPLKIANRVVGALDVQSTQEAAFSEEDVTVLQTMADLIVIAIENARLFQETQQALQEVQAAQRQYIAQEWERLSLEREDLYAEYCSLGIPSLLERHSDGAHSDGAPSLDTAWTPEMEMAWSQEAPVLLPDLTSENTGEDAGNGAHKTQHPNQITPSTLSARSSLAVPIRLRGEVIGVLDLQETDAPRFWTNEEVAMVTSVTDQLGLALENARLIEETRMRAEQLAVLNQLGQALTAQLTVEGVLDQTYRGASRLLDTTNFYIALYDPESQSVSFPKAIEDGQAVEWPVRQVGDAADGLTEYIIRNRQPLLLRDHLPQHLEELGIQAIGRPARSWMGVPLVIGDRVLGVMAVQSHTTPAAYDQQDHNLLRAIATQAAIALQNAILYEQAQRRAWRERVAREIGAKVTGSVDIERILKTTARELSQALGATHAVIHMGTKGEVTDDQVSDASPST